MLTTLDHLQAHIAHRKPTTFWGYYFREIKVFSGLFVTIFIITTVSTNAQLYRQTAQDVRESAYAKASTLVSTTPSAYHAVAPGTSTLGVDTQFQEKQALLQTIEAKIEQEQTVSTEDFISADIVQSSLKQRLNSYGMDFNLLPPTNRIMIESIALDAPLIRSSFTKPIQEITNEDFDKDLYHGIVQYPTTPDPGQGGNTLLFGHTSYEARKNNPYATILRNIAKINNNDTIQIVRQGKLYKYSVIEKRVVSPKNVNTVYTEYSTNGEFITLLGCYPIGSDKSRILIIAKRLADQ